jgi:hypothetical protein
MTAMDVLVTHPPAAANQAASAATDGVAAAKHDAGKRCAYTLRAPHGYQPRRPSLWSAMTALTGPPSGFLGVLDAEAAAVGDVSRSSFVAVALRELSKGLS